MTIGTAANQAISPVGSRPVIGLLPTNVYSFPKRSAFPFLDGGARLGSIGSRAWLASDVGPLEPGATATTLLIAFSKLIDATNTDGDGGDNEGILQAYTRGVGLRDRLLVGTAVDEDFPLPAPTNAAGLSQPFNASTSPVTTYSQPLGIDTANPLYALPVPRAELDISNHPGSPPPEAVYLVLTAPGLGTNGSTTTGLYARRIDLLGLRSGQLTGLPAAIQPSAGASGPGSSGFMAPARLDRAELGSANPPSLALHGRALLAVWIQDHHIWGQVTRDGLEWRRKGGAPDPFLVDPGSADAIGGALHLCLNRGEAADGLIVIHQYDQNGPTAGGADLRARVRTRLRFW